MELHVNIFNLVRLCRFCEKFFPFNVSHYCYQLHGKKENFLLVKEKTKKQQWKMLTESSARLMKKWMRNSWSELLFVDSWNSCKKRKKRIDSPWKIKHWKSGSRRKSAKKKEERKREEKAREKIRLQLITGPWISCHHFSIIYSKCLMTLPRTIRCKVISAVW